VPRLLGEDDGIDILARPLLTFDLAQRKGAHRLASPATSKAIIHEAKALAIRHRVGWSGERAIGSKSAPRPPETLMFAAVAGLR